MAPREVYYCVQPGFTGVINNYPTNMTFTGGGGWGRAAHSLGEFYGPMQGHVPLNPPWPAVYYTRTKALRVSFCNDYGALNLSNHPISTAETFPRKEGHACLCQDCPPKAVGKLPPWLERAGLGA